MLIRAFLLASLSCLAGAQDLRLRFLFDETSGSVMNDATGNGHDGSYLGMPGLGHPGARPETGTSVDFDGVDDGALLPTAADLMALTDDFSIVFWARLDNNAPYSPIFGNPPGWTVVLFGDTLRLQTPTEKIFVPHVMPQGWNHVAFVFDASHLASFYVNGALVGSKQAASAAGTPSSDWWVAHSPINSSPPDFLAGGIDDLQLYDGALDAAQVQSLFDNPGTTADGGPIGSNYCGPANLNSTGQPGLISAFGSEQVLNNDVRLDGDQLAINQFSMFVNSMTQGFVMPPGSQGFLCLSGAIGRYNGNIMNTGSGGTVSLQLDLANTPTPGGPVAIQAGETWYFQLWFRDFTTGPTSNTTDAIEVMFR